MAEPFDIYTDAFKIASSPWGTCVVFGVIPAPINVESTGQPTDLGAIRISNEQVKVLIFGLWRSVQQLEEQFGIPIDVSKQVTDQLGIPRENWDLFWTQEGD